MGAADTDNSKKSANEAYEAKIDALLAAATPDPSKEYEQRQYSGALGEYFKAEDTKLRLELKANGKSEEEINAAILQDQKTKSAKIKKAFMEGVDKKASASDKESADNVKEVARLSGFGDGWIGWIIGQIANIPVVGEMVLAATNVARSAFGSLLGMVGLGPEAKMISYGEALQQIQDSQAYANGVNALSGIIGDKTSGLLADLQNAPVSEFPQAIEGKNNHGRDVAQVITFLKELPADEKTSAEAQKLAALLTANIDHVTDPNLQYIVIKMPNGKPAVAAGTLSDDHTSLKIKKIYSENNGNLNESEDTANMSDIATGATAIIPAMEKRVAKAIIKEGTIADSQVELADNMGSGLSNELLMLRAKLTNGLTVDSQKIDDNNMVHVLATIGDKPAIITGTFDSKTNVLSAEYVTMAGEPATQKLQKAIALKPINLTYDAADKLSGVNKNPKILTVEDKELGKAIEEMPEKFIPGESHIALKLPGGGNVIVSGQVVDGKLIPEYETKVIDGKLTPKNAHDKRAISVETGKTIKTEPKAAPKKEEQLEVGNLIAQVINQYNEARAPKGASPD